MERRTSLGCQRFLILLKAHILNPFWHSADRRRKRRGEAIADTVCRYINRHYLPAADKVIPGKTERSKDEKIFSIWFQGEENAPQLVRSCFASIRKHCSQELVVLDENTVFDYISLPEEIVRKYRQGNIKKCHFADICRVELLYRYGGYWLDATCYLTQGIPKDISEQDFFVYLALSNKSTGYSFIQNCFIRAVKGSYLLAAWRAIILDYWLAENRHIEYFQHQLMFKALIESNKTASLLYESMPHIDQSETHTLWYGRGDCPFNADEVTDINAQGFFFQKCAYKDSDRTTPGSFREKIVKGEI